MAQLLAALGLGTAGTAGTALGASEVAGFTPAALGPATGATALGVSIPGVAATPLATAGVPATTGLFGTGGQFGGGYVQQGFGGLENFARGFTGIGTGGEHGTGAQGFGADLQQLAELYAKLQQGQQPATPVAAPPNPVLTPLPAFQPFNPNPQQPDLAALLQMLLRRTA